MKKSTKIFKAIIASTVIIGFVACSKEIDGSGSKAPASIQDQSKRINPGLSYTGQSTIGDTASVKGR